MSLTNDRPAALIGPGGPIAWGELIQRHPTLRPPLIEGILRKGETMNIIANSKVGKSWLVNDLAIAVATGRPWLGIYPTHRGNVLILDNELHRETIAHRLRTVAEARGVEIDPADESIQVLPLRGRLLDMDGIAKEAKKWGPDAFALIIMDAFYRTLPVGVDENSNALMAGVYNTVDGIAEATDAANALVHHSSKGSQSEKSVTDVGSGAGSISRAVDTHLILRRRQEEGAYVLEMRLRSWPPAAQVCLRWHYPLWELAEDLDPAELWTPRGAKKKEERTPFDAWDAERFTQLCPVTPTPAASVLLQAAKAGLSERKANALMTEAIHRGLVHQLRGQGKGGAKLVARAPPIPPIERN